MYIYTIFKVYCLKWFMVQLNLITPPPPLTQGDSTYDVSFLKLLFVHLFIYMFTHINVRHLQHISIKAFYLQILHYGYFCLNCFYFVFFSVYSHLLKSVKTFFHYAIFSRTSSLKDQKH